jgi:hypothetical protein
MCRCPHLLVFHIAPAFNFQLLLISKIHATKMAGKIWRKMNGRSVRFIANAFSFIALIYEGCNQGVMGGVSSNPDFINIHNLGVDGRITKPIKQG